MLILFLVSSFLCAVAIYWHQRRWSLRRKTANIPTMPGELPFLGHLRKFGNSVEFWDYLKGAGDTTNELGGVTKCWMGPLLFFYITDSKIAKEVLNVALDKMFIYKFAASWLRRGLVTASVPTWKRHRKLLNPTFNQQLLNSFLTLFNIEAENFVKTLEDKAGKQEFDIFPHLSKCTLYTICQTALGLSDQDKASGFVEEYGELVERIFSLMNLRLQHVWMTIGSLYNLTRTKKEEDRIAKHLITISTNIIERRKTSFQVKDSGDRFKAFLDVLLEHERNGSLTQQEIRAEVDTIITGGFDTSARALVYILVMLGSFPKVQEKVYDEMKEVFGNSDRVVTKEDLPLLVYTEAVIKEVLRLYPIVPVVGRVARYRDIRVGKYTFPKSSNLVVFISGIHTNHGWGEDAHVFRPERWLSPGTPPEDGFAVFSLGSRNCIGKVYAMMLMKVLLVHLLRRFKVRGDHMRLRSRWDVLLKPASGSEISIEFRV